MLLPALLFVHFGAFAYAIVAQRFHAARDPFNAPPENPVPILATYGAYVQDALSNLSLGTMPTGGGQPIATVMLEMGGRSAGLFGIAFGLSVIIGLLLGLAAVRTDPPRVARWMVPLATTGLAMPSFFAGGVLMALSVFYILRTGARLPFPLQGFGWDLHLVFPVLTLMLRPTAQIAQVTSGTLTAELHQQYVAAARSLGHSWRRIRWHTALRNVFGPIALAIAGALRLLAAELIVIEWLFNWPGLGRLLGWALVSSPTSHPGGALFLYPPVVAAAVTVFAALFLISDLLAALVVRLADPRVRAEVMTHG